MQSVVSARRRASVSSVGDGERPVSVARRVHSRSWYAATAGGVSGACPVARAAPSAGSEGVMGGRPPGRAGMLRHIAVAIERMPPQPSGPMEQWGLPGLLAELARLSLLRARELLARPIENHLDPREQRRVEIGINAGARILARVQVARMQAEAGEQRMVEYEAAVVRYEQELAQEKQVGPAGE
jgi:hypothetical protein